jgi:hypothetical protein
MLSIGPHARPAVVVAVAVVVATVSVAAVVAVVAAVAIVVVVAVILGVIVAVRAVGICSSESGFEGGDFVVFVLELGSEISDRLGELAHDGAVG